MTTTDASDLLSDLLNFDFTEDFINKLMIHLRYVGFDANAILAKVQRYTGNDSVKHQDIFKLVCVGLKEGNMVSNIIKTSNPEFAEWLRKMVIELGIKEKVKGKESVDAGKITLSRLKMTLPNLSFNALKNENFSRKVTTEMISEKIPGVEIMIPFCRDACIMSLLPKQICKELKMDYYFIVISHIFAFCYTETFLVKGSQIECLSSRAAKALNYMRIAYQADHVSEKTKSVYAEKMQNWFDTLSEEKNSVLEKQKTTIMNFASDIHVDILRDFSMKQ